MGAYALVESPEVSPEGDRFLPVVPTTGGGGLPSNRQRLRGFRRTIGTESFRITIKDVSRSGVELSIRNARLFDQRSGRRYVLSCFLAAGYDVPGAEVNRGRREFVQRAHLSIYLIEQLQLAGRFRFAR